MNHLAHTLLSAGNPLEQTGNLVADWIKGRDLSRFPSDFQRGIVRHRRIDSYTDRHPAVHQSKSRLRGYYGKYAGIVVDVVYDHFLAVNWQEHSHVPLPLFIHDLESHLSSNLHLLPEQAQNYFVRFMKLRWLESYATLEGIERVLFFMGNFRSIPQESRAAVDIVRTHYEAFATEFGVVFAGLRSTEMFSAEPMLAGAGDFNPTAAIDSAE